MIYTAPRIAAVMRPAIALTILVAVLIVPTVAPPAIAAEDGNHLAGVIHGRKISGECSYMTDAPSPVALETSPGTATEATFEVQVLIHRDNASNCLPGTLEAGFVIDTPDGPVKTFRYLSHNQNQLRTTLPITLQVTLNAGESITYPTAVYLRLVSFNPTNLSVSRGSVTFATPEAFLPL